ncbi:Uncharacterised protein [uncultured archaeon]|nr:Uncharacterised protein [uncultured archaeon]
MNRQSFFKGLVRNIIIVGFVSVFTDLSSQMVFPVVPLFLLSLSDEEETIEQIFK